MSSSDETSPAQGEQPRVSVASPYREWAQVQAGTMGYDDWMGVEITHHLLPQAPALKVRVAAAVWFLAHFPGGNIPMGTSAVLMYPMTRYTRLGVLKASVRLVTDSLAVALEAAPPERIEQIESALEQCQRQWAPRSE